MFPSEFDIEIQDKGLQITLKSVPDNDMKSALNDVNCLIRCRKIPYHMSGQSFNELITGLYMLLDFNGYKDYIPPQVLRFLMPMCESTETELRTLARSQFGKLMPRPVFSPTDVFTLKAEYEIKPVSVVLSFLSLRQFNSIQQINGQVFYVFLPFITPVRMVINSDKVEVEFPSNSSVKPEELKKVFDNAIENASGKYKMLRIRNGDKKPVSIEELNRIVAPHKLIEYRDEPIDSTCFYNHSMILVYNEDSPLDKLKMAIRDLYSLSKCSKCHLMYNKNDSCGCTKAYHPSEMTPFKDGDMEKEITYNGKTITIVYYPCCGINQKGCPGCKIEQDGQHVIDEEAFTQSCVVSID